MKQGTANHTQSGQKREPISHGVNPNAVGQIGIQTMNTRPVPLYSGRGIEAPKANETIHRSGSQGRHK